MKDRTVYLAAAQECIDLVFDYTAGMSAADFLADRKTQDAVVRNLEIIGQALKDFGVEGRAAEDSVNAHFGHDKSQNWHLIFRMKQKGFGSDFIL